MSTNPQDFPLRRNHREQILALGRYTRAVPWSMIVPHQGRIILNHGQTPEELASNGGLTPGKILAILNDTACVPNCIDPEQELTKRVDAWILKLRMPNDLSDKQ